MASAARAMAWCCSCSTGTRTTSAWISARTRRRCRDGNKRPCFSLEGGGLLRHRMNPDRFDLAVGLHEDAGLDRAIGQDDVEHIQTARVDMPEAHRTDGSVPFAPRADIPTPSH